jgi:adenylate cyclase class 1
VNFEAIDAKQIKLLENRFTRVSQARFIRLLSQFNYTQANAIHLIPFLFHLNHPVLPGYVDKQTPCGLPSYTPDQLAIQLAKGISKTFEFKPRAYFKYEIASLYLMGSMGTLGQSFTSDLDLWVCITEAMSSKQRNKLTQKINLISEWLKSLGIVLNGYLVHCDDFKNQRHKKLDQESCGDTQNYLLLDEFYRTAIWLVGKKPLWWIVSATKNYDDYKSDLIAAHIIDQQEWIDFGEIRSIPTEEYVSASLWHFYKAIESPYKSLVKLILLEVYANQLNQDELLSNEYKALIYQGIDDLNKLDPYAMLLEKAESILKQKPERLEFLRRAFYLKVGCKIELTNKTKPDWRYQNIYDLVKIWGWNQARLNHLNQRLNWNVVELLKERKDLIRELNHSFEFLSSLANDQAAVNEASQEEFYQLKKQLDAVFYEKPNKLLKINYDITKGLLERELTLVEKNNIVDANQAEWLIYIGSIEQKELVFRQPFASDSNLFNLLAWCCYNQIIAFNSSYRVYSENSFYTDKKLQDLVKDLDLHCQAMTQLNQSNFSNNQKVNHIAIYINSQQDPLALEKQQGIYSILEETDIFCWGQNKINLVEQFDLYITNSWNENKVFSYQSKTAWIDFVIEYIEFFDSDQDLLEQQLSFFDQSELPSHYFQERLIELICQWKLLSKQSKTENKNYYYMAFGKGYIRINFNPDKITYNFYSDKNKLEQAIQKNSKQLSSITFDPYLKEIENN